MRLLLELVQHLLNLGSLRVFSMLLVLNELYQDSVIKAAVHQDLTFLFAGGDIGHQVWLGKVAKLRKWLFRSYMLQQLVTI